MNLLTKMGSMKIKSLQKGFFRALIFVLLTLFYCEFLVYYLVLWQCDYPSSSSPLTAMVVADTHLLGSRNGHWWDKLRREWQMHRTFQTANTYFRPKHIFFLGDLFDEGQWSSSEEFSHTVDRFHSLFSVDKMVTRIHVMPGNHDIGFHYKITPYLDKRFKNALRTKAVHLKVIEGVPFVIINSMAFEGDNCFLCKSAVEALAKLSEKLPGLPAPVLFSHFPLYRMSDLHCNEPDEAPADMKAIPFREKWDCVSRESSDLLLDQVKPRLILSGHTHHGCNTTHRGSVTEISVSSFSWRNKNRPAFLLAKLSEESYHIEKCYIPDENYVIYTYIGSLVIFCFSFKTL